ncbi:MAG: class I SAM-dependent methyltransferase [Candidatus Omnitrophica bacterium]|nr:class I SAM-dependent methyltransferase [Candidatus Omnitrophota bacterium]
MTISTKTIRGFQREILDHIVRTNPGLGLDRRAEYFVSLFERYLEKPSTILDIGGGWGFYDEPLRKRGHSPTVVDVVKPGYQKAPVMIYDGNRIPFEDKSFDASLLITVLHHCPDPEEVLREAKRVTRNTLIVVEDIYHHALGRSWCVLRDRIYNMEFFGHPCNFKSAQQWMEIFGRHGFRVVEKIERYTWLAGLRILNGVFILNVGNGS